MGLAKQLLCATESKRSSARRNIIYLFDSTVHFHSYVSGQGCIYNSSLAKKGKGPSFMKHLTYLLSILVFCGIPWLIMLKYQERVLKKYEIVILVVVIIGFLFSASDYFALRWGAWYYDPSKTLNVHFLTEIETYLGGAGVFLEVASATLIWASFVDRKNKKKSRNRKSIQKLRNNKLHNIPIRTYSW